MLSNSITCSHVASSGLENCTRLKKGTRHCPLLGRSTSLLQSSRITHYYLIRDFLSTFFLSVHLYHTCAKIVSHPPPAWWKSSGIPAAVWSSLWNLRLLVSYLPYPHWGTKNNWWLAEMPSSAKYSQCLIQLQKNWQGQSPVLATATIRHGPQWPWHFYDCVHSEHRNHPCKEDLKTAPFMASEDTSATFLSCYVPSVICSLVPVTPMTAHELHAIQSKMTGSILLALAGYNQHSPHSSIAFSPQQSLVWVSMLFNASNKVLCKFRLFLTMWGPSVR